MSDDLRQTFPPFTRPGAGAPLPASFYAFVLRSGGWHQLLVCFLSIAVFLLNAAPIELQRRIIDMAVKGGPASAIMTALLVNCAVILSFGLIKLLMNIYRAWLGECATRTLRLTVDRSLFARTEPRRGWHGAVDDLRRGR